MMQPTQNLTSSSEENTILLPWLVGWLIDWIYTVIHLTLVTLGHLQELKM